MNFIKYLFIVFLIASTASAFADSIDDFDIHGIKIGMNLGEVESIVGHLNLKPEYKFIEQVKVVGFYHALTKKDDYEYVIKFTSEYKNKVIYYIEVIENLGSFKPNWKTLEEKFIEKYGLYYKHIEDSNTFENNSWWSKEFGWGSCKTQLFSKMLDNIKCSGNYLKIRFFELNGNYQIVRQLNNEKISDKNYEMIKLKCEEDKHEKIKSENQKE